MNINWSSVKDSITNMLVRLMSGLIITVRDLVFLMAGIALAFVLCQKIYTWYMDDHVSLRGLSYKGETYRLEPVVFAEPAKKQ